MKIKLKWVNRNVLPIVTRIYRTTTILPNDQLGPPLIELDGAVTEWTDDTAVRGTTYYYVFCTVGGGNNLYTYPLKIDAVYNTGPGPTKLVSGNQSLGYFGQVLALEFFTANELQTLVGIGQVAPAIPLPAWDKWYRNGKILFIPRSVISTSVVFSTLYNRGLVFGTDDNGPWQQSATQVNQLKIITKGFNRFIVRLPTGADDRNNPGRVVADDAPVAIRKYGEAADLIYPTMNQFLPPTQRFPRNTTAVPIFTALDGRAIHTQEKYKTGTLNAVGGTTGITSSAIQQALTDISFNAGAAWKPVLELIQSDLVIGEIVL